MLNRVHWPRSRSDARASTRGQTVPIIAIFMLVLIGFAALVVDYGSYLLARRNYQTLADAASLAGSAQLSRPVDPTKRGYARSAAWEVLQRELGLTFGGGPSPTTDTTAASPYEEAGWSIWVDTPPTAATTKYPGSAAISGGASVFVRLERENPAFLSRVFGFNGRTIEAWATAGTQPSRWAVIALCPRAGACPATTESIKISGSGTSLRIVDGDLGGNWGLRIDTNTADRLQLPGDSEAYLADTTCGASDYLCYPDPNVSDGAGTAKLVKVLPALAQDPNYAEPSWLTDPVAVPSRPNVGGPPGGPVSGGTVVNSTAANVSCDPADATTIRIGPGRYTNIRIANNSCVIFDPTLGLTAGQRPGIYYITGRFEIGNDSFVIGDGVTIFLDGAMTPFNPSGGVVFNTGNAAITGIPSGATKFGAWSTKGSTPWSVAAGSPVTTTWTTPSTSDIGIAFYIRRSGSSYTSVFNMSGTSPLMFQGVLYGPQDNVSISGRGVQAAVGQIVSWTITYRGGTQITQIFDGPADAKSYLLEPRTGQPD